MVLGSKTVTLEVIQPSTGPVCPGQEVILTCTVARTDTLDGNLVLAWTEFKPNSPVSTQNYNKVDPKSGPYVLGVNFITTAVFMTTTDSIVIVSNATLASATLSNTNTNINCMSPPQANVQAVIIIVAGIILLYTYRSYGITNLIIIGAGDVPVALQISASVCLTSLTWLPPPNTNCVFNYTVNITNSSCSMTVYSSSTSLILTDLLTRGQNYSFAVAVTDSTGQHGPWSDQLMVTWDGE